MNLCYFESCDRESTRTGLCSTHYAQKRSGKELKPIRAFVYRRDPICVVVGCGESHCAGGYCQRHYNMWKNFKIQPQQYEYLLECQSGVCAICKDTCSTRLNLSIDHDHETGEVRGLLCTSCNLGLGKFQDSVNLLTSAASYLKLHGKS